MARSRRRGKSPKPTAEPQTQHNQAATRSISIGRDIWAKVVTGAAILSVLGAYTAPLLWMKDIDEARVEITYQTAAAAGGYAFDLVNHAPFAAVVDIAVTPFGQFVAQTTAPLPLNRFMQPSEIAYPFHFSQELGPNETRRIRLPPLVPSVYMTAKEAQATVDLQMRPTGIGPFAVVARLIKGQFVSTKAFEIVDGQWFEAGATRIERDRRCLETPMDVDCTTQILLPR